MATVVIFGAGPGLGMGAARHFGRRGDRIVLVARNRERLEACVSQLADEGITAHAYGGDIAAPDAFDDVTARILTDLGTIDVAIYLTTAPESTASSPLEITAQNERPFIDQTLLAPIHAVHSLLEPMLERGAGAALFALGSSALGPTPTMAQPGIALAGLRHHLLGLAKEAAARGVRVGLLVVGGLILGSDLQRAWFPNAGPEFPGALDPEELATMFEGLLTGEGPPERLVGPYAQRSDDR